MQLIHWLKHNLQHSDIPYILILLMVFSGVVATNFPLNNTWLTGWDNLHPEFNLPLNLKRAFEGVWQINEGLGLVGGHGYAATLPHTLAIWFLSFIFPIHTVRAIFTFLMLLIGSLGTYFVTTHLLREYINNRISATTRIAGLFAALFMMLNIGTIQNFYIQLEAFIVHFAFLPWLILTTWQYLHAPSKKTFITFLFVTIAIIPAGFIPPLFVVQNILIGVSLLFFILYKRNRQSILSSFTVIATILCMNAFWLFPFLYYTVTHSQNYLHAYNNLQSTHVFIEKNQKYGDILNVPLMRSFLFESNDITTDGQMTLILKPWIDHIKHPLTQVFGYSIFAISVVGLFLFLVNKNVKHEHKSFSFMFIGIFLLLATNIPPFSWISELLRTMSPLFEQAFRIAFTKFSIAYALSMAVFSGIGLFLFLTRVHKHIRMIVTIGIFSFLGWYALPIFQGNFFYTRTKIAIPTAYNELFTYMKSQPTSGRIMNLPQGQNWGWTNYSWGYSGSGFLWYGIEQPILDRSFDVWSPYNENYYWEVTQALYSKNWVQFDALLKKYNITWILFDDSILAYPSGKWIFSKTDILDHLDKTAGISIDKTFDHLILYKIESNTTQSDISLSSHIPTIAPIYTWNDFDVASLQSLPYVSTTHMPFDIYFPFRSLFTKRSINEKEFTVQKNLQGYTITPLTTPPPGDYIGDRDDFIPVSITATAVKNGVDLSFQFLFPESMEQGLAGEQDMQTWHVQLPQHTDSMTMTMGTEVIPIYKDAAFVFLPHVFPFFTKTNQDIVLTANEKNIGPTIQLALQKNTPRFTGKLFVPYMNGALTYDSNQDVTFFRHKEHDCKTLLSTDQETTMDKNGQSLVFTSTQSDQCFDIILNTLEQKQGYLVEIQSEHIDGNPLHVAVVNKTVQKTDFETTLPTTQSIQTSYIIIPPAQQDGLGYGLHFSNSSLTQKTTKNTLFSVKVTPIPYVYATTLKRNLTPNKPSIPLEVQTVSTMSYLYTTRIPRNTLESTTLILSQAFDEGWKAYTINNQSTNLQIYKWRMKNPLIYIFPFVFGEELKNHVLVNNWENGWTLTNEEQIYKSTNLQMTNENDVTVVIFFWPQLLEWIGFLLIPLPFLFLFLKKSAK